MALVQRLRAINVMVSLIATQNIVGTGRDNIVNLDLINKALYSSSGCVRSYVNTTLQAPEVSILVKYKEAYYGKNILDIGCGAGRTSSYFRNFTSRYVGVDYSKPMVDFCAHQYPSVAFKHCDVRDLSCFGDNEFDFVIFSYNGIDYIDHDGRIQALMEIHRVLKKGGVFVFSTHNRKFKNIVTQPSLQFTYNPVELVRNIINYFRQVNNRKELSSKEVRNENYAILNDSGSNFGLLTYYIDINSQGKQLTEAGFRLLEQFQLNGQTLPLDKDDSDSCWIYFVTEKV